MNFNPFEAGLNGDDCIPPEEYEPDEESYEFNEPSKFSEIKQDWRKNPKFLAIKGISKENLENCTGEIVRGDPINKPQKGGSTLGFGKYKDKTIEWVKENDLRYFEWCHREIKGFAERVKIIK